MGYQFLHIECYARAAGAGKAGGRTIRDVAAEAERHPSACSHIALPRPPVLLHGVTPCEAAALAEQRAAGATDAAGRKFRKDGLCLLGGVVSFPETWEAVDSDAEVSERWTAWERETVDWLRQEYGGRLASVCRHEDEGRPHLHFHVIPDITGERQLRIADVHDGRRAAEGAKAAGAPKGEQNAAYKVAMREYQNRYWQAVGLRHGLTRLGPGKRRLTRGEWRAEQVAATTAAEALRAAQHATTSATEHQVRADNAMAKARVVVADAKAKAAEARTAADAAEAALRQAEAAARTKAQSVLRQANQKARRIVVEAEARTAPMRRLGGWLGCLWSGLRGVEKRLAAGADAKVAAARATASAEVVRAKGVLRAEAKQAVRDELAGLRQAADRANLERQDAEKRMAKAEAAAQAKAAEAHQAKAALNNERSVRSAAEADREKFRQLWADADNALIAMRQPCAGPGHRPNP